MRSYFLVLFLVGIILITCKSRTTGAIQVNHAVKDTVKIANDSLSYEIIIVEPGFYSFLNGTARPRNYYSQHFLEERNRLFVLEWNIRVDMPFVYPPDLYGWHIDYNSTIDYGYEVNYLLYNYFIYFQMRYHQKLSGFIPRP